MDERRRQQERLAGGGDPEVEARVLRERLRVGEVTRDRVRLAAWLLDPAARRVLGWSEDDARADFREWASNALFLPEVFGGVQDACPEDDQLEEAIRRELVPWVLGKNDPAALRQTAAG